MPLISILDLRQRNDADCGVIAAACVLRLFRNRLGYDKIRVGLLTTEMYGTHPSAYEPFFRERGFAVLAGEMTVSDLRQQTDKGRPVITVMHGHYVVVTGVVRGIVHYHDPESGPAKARWESFCDWWRDTDRGARPFIQFGFSVWKPFPEVPE